METAINIDIEKQLLSADGALNLRIKAQIAVGELLVVFGNSGAGKSTLLRMLAGLTTPDRGHISCQGQVWFDSATGINLPPQQRSIGFMFQDYALFPNMTVLENIRYAQPKPDDAVARLLLQRFGLEEFAHRKPSKLSGGQKQRVALARALARQPRLLLLDEPLSALDAEMRRALQDEIAKTHAFQQTTTLLVSHDLSEVFRLAHKVLCIERGAVKAYGTPDEVFINTSVSGKVQITGVLVRIERNDTFYLLTVVTGMNQILKVTAFESDMQNLTEGDQVMVFTKAFNPIVTKMKQKKTN